MLSQEDSTTTNKGPLNLKPGQAFHDDDSDELVSAESDSDEQLNEQKAAPDKRKKRSAKQEKSKSLTVQDKKNAMNLNKQGENMNYKRSIEIKNGIALRSMNNYHKTSNAINLHCYVVSALTEPPSNY